MRIFIVFLLALSGPMPVQAQSFTINGSVKETAPAVNQYIYLAFMQGKQEVVDSCLLKKGHYHFSGKIAYPVNARLFLKVPDTVFAYYVQTRLLKPFVHEFYLDKGKISAVSETVLNKTEIKGSAAEADRQEMAAIVTAIYKKRDSLYGKQRDAAYKAKDSVAIAAINRPYFAFEEEIQQAKLKFMQQHPGTGIVLKLLNEYTRTSIDPLIVQPVFDQMQPALKTSPEGVKYAERLARAKVVANGMEAPALALKNRNGELVTLASLKGKVVLLDFWGSWCYPCRASHPHLKELYAQYKSKGFEILGVSNEKGEEASWYGKWVKAMDEDGMNWLNVLNETTSAEKEKGVLQLFDVQAFPTKILIGADGKILKKLVGNSEKNKEILEEELKRLLPVP